MTLAELCEPLFLYVCRLNRLVRHGGSKDQATVWHEIKAIFAEMRERAARHPGLASQFEKVELPLVFFADEMIRSAHLPWAGRWPNLASEYNELTGDDKFFDLLDDTLGDRTDAASERLGVFYTCLGLGFRGCRAEQPQFLKRKMQEIRPRLREAGGVDAAKLTPEAYDHLRAGREVDVVVGDYVRVIALALVALVAALFVFVGVGYRNASAGLDGSLKEIDRVHREVFGQAAGGGQ